MALTLSPPLRQLKPHLAKTEEALTRALRRAQIDVRARIALAASRAADAATDAKTRERLFAEIGELYRELGQAIDEQIRMLTEKAARVGHEAAVEDMGGKARLVRYDPARNGRYFSFVHPSNAQSVAAVFTNAMTDSAVNALRGAFVDVFRQATVEGMTANETQKALRDRWDAVAGNGDNFRFTDRAGRKWENARYLQMLVRTNAQRVAIESGIDTFAAHGVSLMRIPEDGDGDCPVCAAWEGRIIQIAGQSRRFPTYEDARAAGMFHPNCTHRPVPVDELLDKDEIARQARVGRPPEKLMADRKHMQAQKDEIDERRHMEEDGMTRADARRAVTADRLERAIQSGVFSDEAAKAARMLTPGQLDDIRQKGIPRFEKMRKGDTPGWHKGSAGGRVLLPREPTAKDVLKLLGHEAKPDALPKRDASPEALRLAFTALKGKRRPEASPEEAISLEIEIGKAAAELALKGTDVPNAMRVEGVGEIDFRWGDARRGIRHIVERRDAYTKAHSMEVPTGAEIVKRIPQALAVGGKKVEGRGKGKKTIANYQGVRVVVSKIWDGQETNAWIVSAYDVDAAKAGYRRRK